jgi:signal transduction histidine kinase
MLFEFLRDNRDEILARSRLKLDGRRIPTPTAAELSHGLPLFLDQLIAILQSEKGVRAQQHGKVAESAALHGEDLLRMGLTVGQVVHDYGSICQSVTELAEQSKFSIAAEEFQTFNRCLDDAIAQAVTSFERDRDQSALNPQAMRVASVAHEMRNLLTASLLTYDALASGSVGIHGSTGTLLGTSLRRMRLLIDRTLSDVRIDSGVHPSVPVPVSELFEEIEVVATLEPNERHIQLAIEGGPFAMSVSGDHQILASALANLVQNAFKFTRPSGRVTLRATTVRKRVHIQVEDACGGLPPGKAERMFEPFEPSEPSDPGSTNEVVHVGIGLAISLKGVRACGGDLRVRNLPGKGCVFTMELDDAGNSPSTR